MLRGRTVPIEFIHPVLGVAFLAVCAIVTEILVVSRRKGW
jgi:hypothetical protein